MNRLQRNRGGVNKVHVPVDTAVETKIAEIRRNPVGIRGVVTADCDPNVILCICKWQSLDGFGDVEVKLVITALVNSDEHGPDPQRGRLTRPLEVQNRSPFGKGITQCKLGTVPPLAAKIRIVGVARVVGVEAVGKDGGPP